MCKAEYAQKIDKAIFPGIQGGPLEHIIAGKAVAFGEALKPEFIEYQKQVIKNANAMAKTFIENGIKLVSNGTDNHLMLLNLTDTGLTGKDLEKALDKVGITVNKNTIPNETQSPFVTSGIRIGTPSVTTRGMKEPEMVEIAKMIIRVIKEGKNCYKEVKEQVRNLTKRFPLNY